MNKIEIYLLKTEKVKEYDNSYFSAHFPNRLNKSFALKNKEDALRSLGVAVLLKEVLNLTEKDILIDENGKPFTNNKNVKFSISHSGEYVVLAVSDAEVGLDIERIDEGRKNPLKKALTDREFKWVNGEIEKFVTVWTLKEALSKTIGVGLKLGFANTDILPMTEEKPIRIGNKNYFGKTVFLDNYVCSVVSNKSANIIINRI